MLLNTTTTTVTALAQAFVKAADARGASPQGVNSVAMALNRNAGIRTLRDTANVTRRTQAMLEKDASR